MEIAGVIKYGMIAVGAVVILASFWFHSVKKMTSDLAVAWALLGAVLVIVGAVPVLSAWIQKISGWTGLALFCVGAVCLWGAFQLTLQISRLLMQNQELAMQISLLLQENERLLSKLKDEKADLEEENGSEIQNEKDTVRN